MNAIAPIGLLLCWAGLLVIGGWLATREQNDKD